eukprot:SM000291S10856  [mRNA]  locus=s291:101361:103982:+ [translate_table: standard]
MTAAASRPPPPSASAPRDPLQLPPLPASRPRPGGRAVCRLGLTPSMLLHPCWLGRSAAPAPGWPGSLLRGPAAWRPAAPGRRAKATQRRGRPYANAAAAGSEREESSPHEANPLDVAVKTTSIGDFSRFLSKGDQGAELQTAVVTYSKPKAWWDVLSTELKVDLVSVVHVGDQKYYRSLQEDLDKYDRVLYEMVVDKEKNRTWGRLKKARWKPPKREADSRKAGSVIGTIQQLIAQLLALDFQLEQMDYTRDNWYHADLDYQTFRRLQKERGESLFSFAKEVTLQSTKALVKATALAEDLDPFRRTLLWTARFVPMPLVGLLVIKRMCASSHAPLRRAPEVRALLDLDIASALKVMLAKQITTDLVDSASFVMERSVIIGARNEVAMKELEVAIREGCRKIAILYGSGHLPDMDRRMRKDFGLQPVSLQWKTAWDIREREWPRTGALSSLLAVAAKVSGWPLNRYQTLALLLYSLVLAIDLYFWEVLLRALDGYVQQVLVSVSQILDQGWNL